MTMPGLSNAPTDVQRLAESWPLCYEFDLQKGDKVIVAGAYKGIVMDLLLSLYPGILIWGFDPQGWAIQLAQLRLERHPGTWALYPFGLGTKTATQIMGEYHTDACSFVHTGPGAREMGEGNMVELKETMKYIGVSDIDLFVCNMEGYEFVLLPYLRSIGWLDHFKRMAIQWHTDLSPEYNEEYMDKLIDMLEKAGLTTVLDERPAWTYHEVEQ